MYESFLNRFKELREQQDIQRADARILARLSDGVVLIVRSGKTTRDMATDACRQFHEDRTAVIGTILNMWDPRDSNRTAHSNYYDSYYEYYA